MNTYLIYLDGFQGTDTQENLENGMDEKLKNLTPDTIDLSEFL